MSKAISKEEFKKRIKERFPNEKYEIIEYTTMSNPSKILCIKCGKTIESPQAKNFLAKHKKAGCSDCYGLRAKNKNNIEKVKEKYNILKEERDETSKIWYTCECKKCKRISTHLLSSFLENTCRCEGKGNRWTEKEFKQKLYEEFGNEYILLSPFKTVNDKSLFKHTCGFAWSTTPAHVLYNKVGCPKCCKEQSKGAKIIESELKNLNINYEKERYLENSLQRFDFYFEINNKKYAIEYNGEQHYKYIPFFHGNDINNFYKRQERDKRKAQYCKDNDIELIIIPYIFSHEEIRRYINKLFSSSTTSPLDVASSEAKKCSSI